MKKMHLASYHEDNPSMCFVKDKHPVLINAETFKKMMHDKNQSDLICKRCKEIFRQMFK